MEPEDQNHLNLSPSASPTPHPRRAICPNCTRPNPVCLCHTLPTHPIPTQTQIIILHHPHEAQHKLSTTPILTKTLSNATTIVSRRLRPGLSPLLDQSPPSIYLFPQTQFSPALNLARIKEPNSPLSKHPPSVLIVFDATWKHAREMVKASEGFLSGFATRVCLDTDERVEGGSIYNSELVLRKEPFGGCVTTMEAVARALGVIEPNGLEIEEKMIGVLREMVRLQAGFLRNVKPRPKLLKKGKSKEETQESNCTSSEN
ncbi:hypothetical protein UlMin_005995 [Ulmus minor]